MSTLALIVSAAFCAVPPNVHQESGRKRYFVNPVDQASADPSFSVFRDQFAAAVKARNGFVVKASLDEPIKASLGDYLSQPRSDFGGLEQREWRELESVMALGGSFTTTRGAVKGRREFCAPYVYTEYPRPEPVELLDEGHPWVILGAHTEVHQTSSTSSRVIGELAYDLVKATGTTDTNAEAPQWREVVMPSGSIGWVRVSEIRDPQDYHACFAKFGETWRMVQFKRSFPPL